LARADIPALLREFYLPATVILCFSLFLPTILWGVLQTLAVDPVLASILRSFCFSIFPLMVVVGYPLKRTFLWLRDLRNNIRDERYLVGKRLHNLVQPDPQQEAM